MTTNRNPGALLYAAHLSLAGALAGSPELRRELYDFHSEPGRGGGSIQQVLWDNLHAEAAMCIWEAIIEAQLAWWDRYRQMPKTDTPEWALEMMDAQDGEGSYGMRHVARHLAFEIEALWLTIAEVAGPKGKDFDFSFCPWVIQWVDWSAIGSDQIAHLKPGTAEAAMHWVLADE